MKFSRPCAVWASGGKEDPTYLDNMRILMPNRKLRKHLIDCLKDFYEHQDKKVLVKVLKAVGDYYKLPGPRLHLTHFIFSDCLGFTAENGTITMMHPEIWARRRSLNEVDDWVSVFLHELGHWYLWANAEKKADSFADQWETGLE